MSGIAGLMDVTGRPVNLAELRAMMQTMAYRGPDGSDEWFGEHIALGQCSFHTTAEASQSSLPLRSDDGHVLVMDGRVDNWEELRETVLQKGGRLPNRSDASLVLEAYRIWGEACVEHIDGDFALAIWKPGDGQLFCARDRLGFKPFFYHWNGTKFYFASDIAALARLPGIPREIDEDMVAQVVGDTFLSNEGTIWRGILRLPPKHTLTLGTNGLRTSAYWLPEKVRDIRYKTLEDYVDHYRDLLFDEVRRVSRTQGALGSEVSGGLDSSAVFSVAHAIDEQGSLLASELKGYTLAFPFSDTTSDLPYARAVGNHLNTQVSEIHPSRPSLSWYESFARDRLTLPPRPNGTMELDLFKTARGDGCRVVLNGVGGDEWLKGSAYAASELISKGELRLLLRYFTGLQQTRGTLGALEEFLQFGVYPLLPLGLRLRVRRARGQRVLENRSSVVLSPMLAGRLKSLRQQYDPTLQRQDMEYRAPHRYAVDWPFLLRANESMELLASLQGVELRSPLASRRMVEFSYAIPQALRRWTGADRWLHRRACEGLVAPEVLARQGKAVFSDVFLDLSAQLTARDDWKESAVDANWANPSGLQGVVDRAVADPEFFASHRIMWNVFSCSSIRFG